MQRKITPINGRVFIQRDPDIEEKDGFVVGEQSKVKAVTGTVVCVDADCCVKEGDRVHLPYQTGRIEEVVVDGRELACVKAADLFGILEKGNRLRPINRYVVGRKCENDHVRDESGEIALYMTQNHIEFTNWMEVIDCAEDCRFDFSEYKGYFFVAPENHEDLQRIGHSDDWCIKEDLIRFLTDGDDDEEY